MTLRRSLLLTALLCLGCSGELWKDMTATVVGKTVETTKGVAKGVSDGIEEGRKAGQSMDDAVIVTTREELEAVGDVTVYAVRASDGGAEVVLALENRGELPMRVSGLEVMALDRESFAKRVLDGPREVTVPAAAREQAGFRFGIAPADIGLVRVWGQDLEVPTTAPDAGADDAGSAPTEPPAPE